jgi:photosynthetic reaction center H subunit
MGTGAITQYIDVAQIAFYIFLLFFIGLVIYLTLESKREGFPLETERFGQVRREEGILGMPRPVTYKTEFGKTYTAPLPTPPEVERIAAEPSHPWNGAPMQPTGNPMLAGVGPGSYAQRADHVDYDLEGHARIRPLRLLPAFALSAKDRNPIGMEVVGADGNVAGVVTDAWIDHMEVTIRYLEVKLGSGNTVLLPINFCRIGKHDIAVKSILSTQFAHVPTTKHPEQITLLEEEKVMAYYGGGTLYATPDRQEPLV